MNVPGMNVSRMNVSGVNIPGVNVSMMNVPRMKTLFFTAILLFCIFPFLFVETAAATTSNYALSTPTVQSDSTVQLGSLYISEASYPNSLKAGDTVSISFPTSAELQNLQIQETAASTDATHPAANVTISMYKVSSTFKVSGTTGNGPINATYSYGAISDPISSGKPITTGGPARSFSVQVSDNNRFSIMINQGFTDGSTYYKFLISFQQVYIKPLGPNDPTAIAATLDAPPSSGFSTGSYTLANVAVVGTTASVDAPLSSGTSQTYIVPILGQDGGRVAPIIIKETAPGSLATSGTVNLALPPGFTWSNVSIIQDWGFSPNDTHLTPPGPDVGYRVTTDDSGQSIVSLTINKATTSSTGIGRITVNGSVDVDSSVAQTGDILVSYGGTNQGVSAATLTVATYAANGVTASQETTTDVVAGRLNQQVGQFSVQEQTPGDLPPGRTVTFTLPDGAKWHTIPVVVRQAGNGALSAGVLNSDRNILKYTVTGTSTARSYFVFRNGSVDLAVNNPDTLNVTVGGSGGVTGTETIANIMQPLNLAAEKKTVGLGVQNQSLGDITITEQSAGALRAKDASGAQTLLTLELPPGVTFSQTPAVAVSGGNLSLATSDVSVESGGRLLSIPVTQASSVPSTITVSGIKVDVDRTVPEGELKMEIGGTAIAQTSGIFADNLNKEYLVIASCSTPAPENSNGAAVFTIGQASYTVGGQPVTMDVAPYIKDGRTMIPLRYAANAVGVADKNILWDGGSSTVTLVKGGRVIQLQIGKNAISINGVDIATDVAPEIKDGRTMLPISAMGTALGSVLEWNEADRTVTVKAG